MLVLVLGLALWVAGHAFKRVAPDRRAALGAPGRGLVSVVLLVSLALIIMGYRNAAFIPLWTPPAFFTHVNNLLMLGAIYVFLSGMAAPALWVARIKHPQLTGFKIWAVAHLLVNGDVASVVLFGGLLAWAIGTLIVINRQEGAWMRPASAPVKREWQMAGIALFAYVGIAAIHAWLGVIPFG